MKKTMIFKPAIVSVVLGMGTMLAASTATADDDAPASLHEDAVSLVQAVEIAKNATGGVAFEAERDAERGQAVYEIELLKTPGEEIHAVVNATTGEVMFTKRRDHDDHHGHDDELMEDAMWLNGIQAGTLLSLEQAAMNVESEFGGKVWSIGQDDHYGQPSYDIELLDANGRHVETRINAKVVK